MLQRTYNASPEDLQGPGGFPFFTNLLNQAQSSCKLMLPSLVLSKMMVFCRGHSHRAQFGIPSALTLLFPYTFLSMAMRWRVKQTWGEPEDSCRSLSPAQRSTALLTEICHLDQWLVRGHQGGRILSRCSRRLRGVVDNHSDRPSRYSRHDHLHRDTGWNNQNISLFYRMGAIRHLQTLFSIHPVKCLNARVMMHREAVAQHWGTI